MRKSPDEGRFVRHPSTINEFLRQFPDDDPLQLKHLGDEEFERRVIWCSLLALTPSAPGPETTVRVESAVDPSPPSSDDIHSSVSSERGAPPA